MENCFAVVRNNGFYKSSFIKYVTKSRARSRYQLVENMIDSDTDISDQDLVANILKVCPHAVSAVRGRERVHALREFIGPVNSYCDIGCGDMSVTCALAAGLECKTVYAVDTFKMESAASQSSVVTALPNGVMYVQSDDVKQLPGQMFDLITLFMTLHHVHPGDLGTLLDQCRRLLRPSGTLILREHNDDGTREFQAFMRLIHIYNQDLTECNMRSHQQWDRVLAARGFELTKKYMYGDPNPQRVYHARYRLTSRSRQ